jgi:hypothetical protein
VFVLRGQRAPLPFEGSRYQPKSPYTTASATFSTSAACASGFTLRQTFTTLTGAPDAPPRARAGMMRVVLDVSLVRGLQNNVAGV